MTNCNNQVACICNSNIEKQASVTIVHQPRPKGQHNRYIVVKSLTNEHEDHDFILYVQGLTVLNATIVGITRTLKEAKALCNNIWTQGYTKGK